jgi:hypothetical protein
MHVFISNFCKVSDGQQINILQSLHENSFWNNINLLANRPHLQKLGLSESHNYHLLLFC